MKIVTLVARTLMGLMFLFASVTYFFELITPPPAEGAMKIFNDGLDAAVYLMPTVKFVELVCGLAFVTGKFVPLAAVLISPILVNIVGVHLFLDRTGLPIAVALLAANVLLIYRHRHAYRGLTQA